MKKILAALVVVLASLVTAAPATTTAGVNLRLSPNTSARVLTVIKQGTRVEMGACSAGWCKVTFGKQSGFVNQQYLKALASAPAKETPNVSSGGSGYVNSAGNWVPSPPTATRFPLERLPGAAMALTPSVRAAAAPAAGTVG